MKRSKVLENKDKYGQVQVCSKVGSWDALWGACVSAFQRTVAGGSVSLALSQLHCHFRRLHITLVSRTVTVYAVILGGGAEKKGGSRQNWTEKKQPSVFF